MPGASPDERQLPTVECPKCHHRIPLTEAISAPILEQQRIQFEEETRRLRSAAAAAQAALREELTRELRAEQERRIEEARRRQAEAQSVELADLRAQVAEKAARLEESRKTELELLRRQREWEERSAQIELENARKLEAERARLREEVVAQAAEQARLQSAAREQETALRLAERDEKIATMQRQAEAMERQMSELRRKAEQGSQQAQGEALETQLEGLLRSRFPFDEIEAVKKGVYGADVVQRVRGPHGRLCGAILWESKNTKKWEGKWIGKLRDDQRAIGAEACVLVSVTLPEDVTTLANVDGAWVASPACAAGLAEVLRAGLIEVETARQAARGQQGKSEALYEYFAGPQFRQRVQGIVEAFSAMQADLQAERRAFERAWSRREKQIERAMVSASGLHGDVSGIVGAEMPALESLDIESLAVEEADRADARLLPE